MGYWVQLPRRLKICVAKCIKNCSNAWTRLGNKRGSPNNFVIRKCHRKHATVWRSLFSQSKPTLTLSEQTMNKTEIIINLWYVCDEWGFIYSLRARAYIGTGSDENKLAMLQKFAQVDYLIARIFAIPVEFRIDGSLIYHKDALWLLDSPIAFFEEAIKALQSDLPSQTPLDIPVRPLVCLTPLLGDDAGNIRPIISEVKRLS